MTAEYPWIEHDRDWDAAQDTCLRSGVTDGLPVTPPSRERVAAMLSKCAAAPGEVVCVLPPSYAEVTWHDLAVNAVMAGCRPEHLPMIAAAIEAISAPEFNLLGIATTTGSACVCLVVNGPALEAKGLNASTNALGPGAQGNATVGRALSLALRNIGGAVPGEVDMATLGQPGKYTFCLAENAAESPWDPLHAERGFSRGDDVVTAFGVSGTIEVVDSESRAPEDLAQTFAQSMLIAGNVGGSGLLGGGEPLILMPPEMAGAFAAAGCSKADTKRLIWERARLPVDRLATPLRERALASGGVVDGCLTVAEKPEDVTIVVAGGVGRKAAYVPTWSGGTRAVSRRF